MGLAINIPNTVFIIIWNFISGKFASMSINKTY